MKRLLPVVWSSGEDVLQANRQPAQSSVQTTDSPSQSHRKANAVSGGFLYRHQIVNAINLLAVRIVNHHGDSLR